VAAFVEPGVVVLAWTDDPADPQHDRCAQALDVLTGATDAGGRPIRVERLPLPSPRHPTAEELNGLDRTPAGQLPPTRIPASYCNYYLANGHVLVPLLDPATDAEAVATLSRLFPDRTVVPLDTRELLLGGGNIHCATQQVPAATRLDPAEPG
jgi:agmatine deiminase